MKHLKVVGLTLLSISLITGCASTDDSVKKDVTGNFIFPSMKPIKDINYVWDESISEALNVAQMAQPAGIANSMRDYADGRNASVGLISSVSRIFDGSLGLLTSGGFGLVQAESLNQGVNRVVEWKPTIVDIVDKDLISENGEISFIKARNYLAQKVRKAIEKDHPNIIWGDTLTLKRNDFRPELWQIIKGDECDKIQSFDKGGEDGVPSITKNYSQFFYDGDNKVETFCSYTMQVKVTHLFHDNKVVLIGEASKGHFLDKSLALNYEGYVLVPDEYFANSNYKVVNQYAFVAKNGEQLLFQKP